MQQKYSFFVSLNKILSVKSFSLTLFDITDSVASTLKPGVGNRPVITNAYLSQVDQIA